MKLPVAERLKNVNEYYFSRKLSEIEELRKSGKSITNLGIGSPDLPPHPSVIDTLNKESSKANQHAYQSYRGSPVLRKSFSNWYNKYYKVDLNHENEIYPLIGSKEGILHICMTFINKGDKVLIPNPGYPTYRSAVSLAEGICIDYNLVAEKNWLPDFEELESTDLSGVKMMWINYPHMPTGKTPDINLFTKIVAFGKKHNILICHDNPYSFILNENPLSILSVNGAKDLVIELNSLSKSHNMAGWRVGVLAASEDNLNQVLRFKSNMDSGMFLPLQLAAAKALELPDSWYKELNSVYKERRSYALQLLDKLNCRYESNQAGLFIWAKTPENIDGYSFSDRILYDYGIFITPGGIFGNSGNNYIRVSLCAPVNIFIEAINKIRGLI